MVTPLAGEAGPGQIVGVVGVQQRVGGQALIGDIERECDRDATCDAVCS